MVNYPANSIISSGPFEFAANGRGGNHLGTHGGAGFGSNGGLRTSNFDLPMQIHVEDPSQAGRGTLNPMIGNEIEDEIERLRREND